MILEETCRFLLEEYGDQFGNLTIQDVRMGIHLAAVRLSDNSVGVAGTLKDESIFCRKQDRDFNDFTPNMIKGRKVVELFEVQKSSGIINTLRIAVLNAMSGTLADNGRYRVIWDKDPVELVDLQPGMTIAIVGAFQSYIQNLAETGNRLFVLELDENTLSDDQKQFYIPANKFQQVLPVSDVVIITGLTLVNNTIDRLLQAVSPHAQLVVTGPSGCMIPDILFRHKVNIIGGIRITDPELLFDIVGESGAAYHLFKYCARKICILPR
jgi:uncharacterized protein (DUF4213/DUF364 family)